MLFRPVADYLHRQIYAKYGRRTFYQKYPYLMHSVVNNVLLGLGAFLKGYTLYIILIPIEKLLRYTYFKGNSPSIIGDYLNNMSHPITPPFYQPNPNDVKVR